MNKNNFEIEKKFLLKNLPNDLETYPKKEFSQGYISRKPTIRIRKEDDKYFLTLKGSGSIKRIEYNLEITKKEYKNLLEKVDGNIVNKTRYFIPIQNNLVAELDVYHDNLVGLYTVEVEFDTEKRCNDFVKPSWFSDDVSEDRKYKNTSLSICKERFW